MDWTYFRLIFLQIGLPLDVIDWIMSCVTTARFAILVNGFPSKFLKSTKGFQQGCPLSPLLFFLVIEFLSHMINHTKLDQEIRWIKVSANHNISHLPFMDDVLLFGEGTFDEWRPYDGIIKILCSSSWMEVSLYKYVLYHNKVQEEVIQHVTTFLPLLRAFIES